MKIITNNKISNNVVSFRAYTPKQVITFYRNIDDTFIRSAKKQGIEKSTILAILERMALNPKFSQRTSNDILSELSQKIQQTISYLDNCNNIEELKTILKLPTNNIRTLICKREQARRNEEIAELFRKNISMAEIAEKFSIQVSTVEQILRAFGINLNFKAEKTAKAIELLKSGVKGQDVAKELGLNTSTINAIRQREHIPSTRSCIIEKRNTAIIEKIKMGVSHREIAIEFKTSKRNIDKIAEELGIKATLDNTQKTILSKLETGEGINKIAEELGKTSPEILKHARNLGFSAKDAKILREKAILKALESKNATDVAKEFGVAINTVYNIKRRYK